MNRNKTQSGFTLIELLVIISIIAFLAAAVLVGLQNGRAKARDARRVADTKQIVSALTLFYTNCGTYPIETAQIALDSSLSLYLGPTGCGDKTGASNQGGIGSVPNGTVLVQKFSDAPLPPGTGCTDDNTASTSNRYLYSTDSSGSTYTLTFCIGAPVGGYATAGLKTISP